VEPDAKKRIKQHVMMSSITRGQLEALAEKLDCTMSEVVRYAIRSLHGSVIIRREEVHI